MIPLNVATVMTILAWIMRSSRVVLPLKHKSGFEQGKTCIDCHKGIAHELPDEYEEEDEEEDDDEA